MGPNYIKELFSLRSSNYDLRGYCKVNQPTCKSKYLHRCINGYRRNAGGNPAMD